MNADHEFVALDWNYASVQDTAGHSKLKSKDGDFPTFEIDQNEPTDMRPSTSRALTLQELVIYFEQSAEDPVKYNKIAKFSLWMQIHAVMPHLHIRANGEAKDEQTNHIFTSSFVASFASPFVALALEAVFRTQVKEEEWQFTL